MIARVGVLVFVLFAAMHSFAAERVIAPLQMPGPPLPRPDEKMACQDVITHHCRLVPETKQIKKTVYEVKEVPFCLKKLPPLFSRHRGCCAECPLCDCPRYKKVLIKKEIVCEEICDTKCVIEEGAHHVPCRVCPPGCSEIALPVIPADAGVLRAAPTDHVLIPVVAPVLTR